MIDEIHLSLEEILSIKQDLREVANIPNTIPFSAYYSYMAWQEDLDSIPLSPKYLDFTKNRYSESGVPCGISSVGNFTRLSSATMLQDGQLVEVQSNIPRISTAGLLIEKSSTESIPNNLTITSTRDTWSATSKPDTQIGNVFEFVSDGSSAIVRTDIPVYPNGIVSPYNGYYYRSILAKKASADSFLALGSDAANSRLTVNLKNGSVEHIGSIVVESKITDINEYYLIETLSTAAVANLQQCWFHASNNRGSTTTLAAPSIGHKVTVALPSFQDTADFPQSVVKTSGTRVTRAPDILIIDVEPNQYISGEWDDGVIFEQFSGYAKFSGHGYIRNIEVLDLQGRPAQ